MSLLPFPTGDDAAPADGSFQDEYALAVAQAKVEQAKVHADTARQQQEDADALEARQRADAQLRAEARAQYSTAEAQGQAEAALRVPPPRPPPGPPPPLPDPNDPLSYLPRHSFSQDRGSFSEPGGGDLRRSLSTSAHGAGGGPRPPPGPPPPLTDGEGLDGSSHSLRRSYSSGPRSAEEVMAAAAARSGQLQRTASTSSTSRAKPPPGPPPAIGNYDPYRNRNSSYAGQRPSLTGDGQLDRVSLSGDPSDSNPFGPPRERREVQSRFACFSFFRKTCK
jgi:hypothetical protein